jgi:hypothetical protein
MVTTPCGTLSDATARDPIQLALQRHQQDRMARAVPRRVHEVAETIEIRHSDHHFSLGCQGLGHLISPYDQKGLRHFNDSDHVARCLGLVFDAFDAESP